MARMPKMPRGANPRGTMPPKARKGTLKRLLGMLCSQNKKLLVAIIVCIVITSVTGVASSFFLKRLLEIINQGLAYVGDGYSGSQALDIVLPSLITVFAIMGGVYLINVICSFIYITYF